MTSTLGRRGPDSAGFAVYTQAESGRIKLTVQAKDRTALAALVEAVSERFGDDVGVTKRFTHAVLSVPVRQVVELRAWLADMPGIAVVSEGQRLEIFKEVGYPDDVAREFDLASIGGTHGIAHTRMATESAVTTDGAHPFSTGADQCLVHNGSISNHASLRRRLQQDGIVMLTANDSEVAAGYLTREMRDGKSLGKSLESSIDDLDGFFTFVVGTENGFGVLRDPIACKPAVMAETDAYVAFASEYKTLTCLPGIDQARVWEPRPATVYFWEHAQ
jgi:glutamate synthase domain-containing protein 1